MFDDVFVPWENTLVYRNVPLTNAQFFATPAHVYINTQAQIRCWTKLQFIAGLARRVAETNGTAKDPHVADALGRLAASVAMIEAGVRAMETAAEPVGTSYVRPNARLMYATMATAAPTYASAIEVLRTLCGGGVIQVPSSVEDLLAEESGADFRRYVRSPGKPAEERIALFKLAWDVIGTEFAGRHQQYELFYSGGPHVGRAYVNRNYDWASAAEQLVERCLAETGLRRLRGKLAGVWDAGSPRRALRRRAASCWAYASLWTSDAVWSLTHALTVGPIMRLVGLLITGAGQPLGYYNELADASRAEGRGCAASTGSTSAVGGALRWSA